MLPLKAAVPLNAPAQEARDEQSLIAAINAERVRQRGLLIALQTDPAADRDSP